jgi:hypothetical protein
MKIRRPEQNRRQSERGKDRFAPKRCGRWSCVTATEKCLVSPTCSLTLIIISKADSGKRSEYPATRVGTSEGALGRADRNCFWLSDGELGKRLRGAAPTRRIPSRTALAKTRSDAPRLCSIAPGIRAIENSPRGGIGAFVADAYAERRAARATGPAMHRPERRGGVPFVAVSIGWSATRWGSTVAVRHSERVRVQAGAAAKPPANFNTDPERRDEHGKKQ